MLKVNRSRWWWRWWAQSDDNTSDDPLGQGS